MKVSPFEPHHIGSVTIQQLRCFAAVACRKTYRGLESDIGIAQPAVSRAVMRLEDILGAKLFEPDNRTALTAFGGKVYRETERILGMIESLKRLALDEAGRGRLTGTVTIGAKSILAETILPALIGKFRKKHRRAHIRVRCGSGDDLLRMLRAGEIDIAISHRRPCPAGIGFRSLRSYPRLLVVPKRHPLAKGPLTAARIAAADLILPGRKTRTHAELMEALSQSVTEDEIKNVIEVTSPESQINYVAMGWGVTVIDGSAANLVSNSLVTRPLPTSLLPERDVGIFHSAERYTPGAVKQFFESIGEFDAD